MLGLRLLTLKVGHQRIPDPEEALPLQRIESAIPVALRS